MKLKTIVDESFDNYKTCSMLVAFPKCSFKCGACLCHNSPLALAEEKEVSFEDIAQRYINNPVSNAIVCGGLEPFDSFLDLADLICTLRNHTSDPIVVYTGYTEDELSEEIEYIAFRYSNIIVKFGRYIPGQAPHYDKVLGVELSSDNQYGKVIS
jgi:hypothetical protein